jgi:hypothetical protein
MAGQAAGEFAEPILPVFLTATGGVFVFVPCAGFSEIFVWRTTDR